MRNVYFEDFLTESFIPSETQQSTPWEINMEPQKNHLFVKENQLSNIRIFLGSKRQFSKGGVVQLGLENPNGLPDLANLLQDKQAVDRLSVMLAKFQRLQVG